MELSSEEPLHNAIELFVTHAQELGLADPRGISVEDICNYLKIRQIPFYRQQVARHCWILVHNGVAVMESGYLKPREEVPSEQIDLEKHLKNQEVLRSVLIFEWQKEIDRLKACIAGIQK